ncbi:MAG: hypothetical protein Q9220_003598 [cf. Caloplaca sp. 1 TL-2023]
MSSARLPEHCQPTTSVLIDLSSTFHSCLPTPLALLSTILGILSIISWLCAQLPQIFKNYSLQSASGLSIYFLAEWLLGDLTNLLGALLTRQAAWQVVVAAYYVTVDICLVTQYFWYSHYKLWRVTVLSDRETGHSDRRHSAPADVVGGSGVLHAKNDPRSIATTERKGAEEEESNTFSRPKSADNNGLFHGARYSWSPKEKNPPGSSYRSIRRAQTSPSLAVSPNTVLLISMTFALLAKASPISLISHDSEAVAEHSDSVELAGRVLSWTSTILYLGSRLPQIYKNYRRRSTSGLSPALFIAAFFGNFFYSASLLANPLAWDDAPPYGLHGWAGAEGNDRAAWAALATPFFLGAAGVLIMDAIIGLQFLLFGEPEAESKIVVVEDERGRSRHWRKVSGWMRGWIPSPGPKGSGDDDERPLLGGDHENNEHRYGGT